MDETLNVVIFLVGSGLAFFSGAGLILLGVVLSIFSRARILTFTRNLAVLIGGIFVAVSAMPLDWWVYIVVGLATVVWLPLEWYAESIPKKWLATVRGIVAAGWLLALAMELPYHLMPTLPTMGNPTLFLIGDSVSAGMSDAEKDRWPQLLARDHGIVVKDLSKMGATVNSARKQAGRIGAEPGLVLLEIGGNDVLGTTDADQYAERLELLLEDVCRADRTVVMLELPLPPFANRYGMIQRRLARKFDVFLIPRRIFINVLTTPGATVDGVHLTPTGHDLMSEAMWYVVRSAYTA